MGSVPFASRPLALLVLALAVTPTAAQIGAPPEGSLAPGDRIVVEVIAVEGEPLPGSLLGEAVSDLNTTHTSGKGGFVHEMTVKQGANFYDVQWGNVFGGPPEVLIREGDFNVPAIVMLGPASASDDGRLTSFVRVSFAGIKEAVFVDEEALLIEGDPVPGMPGWTWWFLNRSGMTSRGVPWWSGTIEDQQNQRIWGIWSGKQAEPLLSSAQPIPGVTTAPMQAVDNSSFAQLSRDGRHHIALIAAITDLDTVVVLDGAALMIDGGVFKEDLALPTSLALEPAETWDSFYGAQITDSQHWVVAGRTDHGIGATSSTSFLMVDGNWRMRSGDVVDGITLALHSATAWINDAGDMTSVWQTSGVGGGWTLFLNDRAILRQDSWLDLDGDGEDDEQVTYIEGGAALSERHPNGAVDVYAVARFGGQPGVPIRHALVKIRSRP